MVEEITEALVVAVEPRIAAANGVAWAPGYRFQVAGRIFIRVHRRSSADD